MTASPPRDAGIRRRWADALLDAMIPAPGDGLPAMAAIDRSAFWPQFERTAPFEVRIGLRLATCALVVAAPFLLGYRNLFTRLDAAARDDVLRRAANLPGGADLMLLVKLVACFAYFDDPGVQRTARSKATP